MRFFRKNLINSETFLTTYIDLDNHESVIHFNQYLFFYSFFINKIKNQNPKNYIV